MSNAAEARRLLRAHRYGVLSTLSKRLDGFPFGSITPYLVDHDGSLLILISSLAEHCKNIRHDPRVSLISHNQSSPDIQMQGRATVMGRAHPVNDPQQSSARYVRHFPETAAYLEMSDFTFYRIQPVAIRYIGGVGRIHWVSMENYSLPQAEAYTRQEESLLNSINTHQQDTLRHLLQQQHGVEAVDVLAIGLDCDGLDVRCEDQLWRLDFTEVLVDPTRLITASNLSSHFPA